MTFKRTIHAVDTHAGTPMRVVTGGIPHIPGNTVHDKMKWMEANDDGLRKLLLREPRGYPAHCCNIIVPPGHPEADAGYIILEQIEYPVMSGGNTISVVTVLLEMGMLPMKEPVTELTLEAPAGLIRIRAECKDGKVKGVTFKNVPAFAAHLDAVIDVPHLGKVTVDVGWGGMFYVIADVRQFKGLELIPQHGAEIARVSSMIRQAAIEQLPVAHPDYPGVGITISQLSGPSEDPKADWKNAVTMASGAFSWDDPTTWTGALDRCPCGTGTCAKMATLHAKGELPLNQDFRHQSLIGNIYTGRLLEETSIGDKKAVVPTITGKSWIYGLNTLVLEHDDPFPEGFTIGDIWA
ncbi:proline racemase family protein [Pseudomonas sp. B21-056]|jgi:proline racemase|uniref:proline racemase family protein n=1 Tax=Pseudomonas sp. B21-056 TaxID=2895495 RepID=UPI002232BE30|nr:proline racemase family protein [Pseudomonas sp. B21-056]UZE26108.1 proline racemase family protein [Pseudomonas sp. B21-056]